MEDLSKKTAYGSPKWRRQRSGARQGLAGLGLLVLAYGLWEARHFIANLATRRVAATAILYTLHDGTEAQLKRAYAAAKMSSPAETSLEQRRNRGDYGVSYFLSVTADTAERAKASLASLTEALKTAFPSAERNLGVSLNNSTVPAPNDLSRRIQFGVVAVVVLTTLGAQLLIMIGAHREGVGWAGILGALSTPFLFLILPSGEGDLPTSFEELLDVEWDLVRLLLAVTPISLILGLWLTRRSRPTAGHRRRA